MKIAHLKNLAFISILLAVQFASAGWSSGGGELLRDQINPWFLRNVSEVKYCILIDEENFGQTKAQVKPRIEKAIEFWKIQFRDLRFFQLESGNTSEQLVNLDKINFIESECDASTDLRLQFGKLTEEQQLRIGNPREFIALTVRTDYDLKAMRGKGFIYFSPQGGPLMPFSDQVVKNFWNVSSGSLLLPTLIHEFGHLFGIQHHPEIAFMDEGFVEMIVSKSRYQYEPIGVPDFFENFENLTWQKIKLFKFSQESSSHFSMATCSTSTIIPEPVDPKPTRYLNQILVAKPLLKKTIQIHEVFGVPPEAECVSHGFDGTKFVVKYKVNESDNWKIAGDMDLEGPDSLIQSSYIQDVISIWIPREQQILDGSNPIFYQNKTSLAYMFSEIPLKGLYKSKDGKQNHRLLLTAIPMGIKSIGGFFNGEIYKDFMRGF